MKEICVQALLVLLDSGTNVHVCSPKSETKSSFYKKNPLFMPYFLLFCNMVQNTTRMQIQGYFRHQVAGYYKKLSNNTTKIYSTKKVNLLGECRMHVLRTAKFSLAQ